MLSPTSAVVANAHHHEQPMGVCEFKHDLKERLLGRTITIDEAINEASNFARANQSNPSARHLVEYLGKLKVWLGRAKTPLMYQRFVKMSLRRAHARLPDWLDLHTRRANA